MFHRHISARRPTYTFQIVNPHKRFIAHPILYLCALVESASSVD
jgi:hypothetical protein